MYSTTSHVEVKSKRTKQKYIADLQQRGVVTGIDVRKQPQKYVEKSGKEKFQSNLFGGSLNEMLTKIDSIQLDSNYIPVAGSSHPSHQSPNVKCSCGDVARRMAPGESISKASAVGTSESDSDNDDDECEISIGKILEILILHHRRARHRTKSLALTNLVTSFQPVTNGISDIYTQQLQLLLDGDSIPVKSCVLVLLRKLGAHQANAKSILVKGVLDKLLNIIEIQDVTLLEETLYCIEKLVSHHNLCDLWLLLMIRRGLPLLLSLLESSLPDRFHIAAVSSLCMLASRHEIAVLLLDHGMQSIMEALRRSQKLRFDRMFGEESQAEEYMSIGKLRCESKSRTERGTVYLSQFLITLMHKEGKMSLDSQRNVQSVGFKSSCHPYCTLSYIISCFFLISTLPLSRSRTRTTSVNRVLFPCFSSKSRKINLKTCTYLIENGALSLIHILNAYRCPSRSTEPLTGDRSMDTLHLQAIMKAWLNLKSNDYQHLEGLTQCEVYFVLKILSVVRVFTQCCSTDWNSDLKNRLNEALAIDREPMDGAGVQEKSNTRRPLRLLDDLKVIDAGEFCTVSVVNTVVNDCSDGPMKSLPVVGGSGDTACGVKGAPKMAWGDDWNENDHHSEKPLLEMLKNKACHFVKTEDGVFELHKRLRIKLYQEGLIDVLMALVRCGVPTLEEEVLLILQCVLQPIMPNERTYYVNQSKLTHVPMKQNSREMAKALATRDHYLSNLISSMSPKTAGAMKEALKTGRSNNKQSKKNDVNKKKKLSGSLPMAFSLHSSQPLSWQCTMHCLELSGSQLIKYFEDGNMTIIESLLLILYDVLSFGEIVIQMKLASLGLLPALLDFICEEHENQFIHLLAVVVLQQLTGDLRLKHICKSEPSFYALKMKVATTTGLLRRELEFFFQRAEVPTDSLGLDYGVG